MCTDLSVEATLFCGYSLKPSAGSMLLFALVTILCQLHIVRIAVSLTIRLISVFYVK